VIDEAVGIDSTKLMGKSLSLHRELMFTRSLFQTPICMNKAAYCKKWRTWSTLSDSHDRPHTDGKISAENLRKAHALLESGPLKAKWCWLASDARAGRRQGPPVGAH